MNHKASSPIAIIFIVLIVVLGSVAIYFMFFAGEEMMECKTCPDCDTVFVFPNGDTYYTDYTGAPSVVHTTTDWWGTWHRSANDEFPYAGYTLFPTIEQLEANIDNLDLYENEKDTVRHILDCIKRNCCMEEG